MCLTDKEAKENIIRISELAKELSNSLMQDDSMENNFIANMAVQFIEESPFVCFVKDADMKFVYVNRPMEEQRGMSRDEMIEKTATELINSGEGQMLDRHGREVLMAGKMKMFLESLPDGNGGRVKSIGIKFPFNINGVIYIGGISIPLEYEVCSQCSTKKERA